MYRARRGAVDTAENRFVLHSLKTLAERLDGFAGEREEDERVSRAWIGGVRGMAAELRKLSRHPFFRGVGRFAGFRQQSLVLQKRAGYAQILAVWMRLKQALKTGGDDVDIGYRPISTLYEFWCFLKMWELLEGMVGPVFAAARPLAAFATGLVGGVAVDVLPQVAAEGASEMLAWWEHLAAALLVVLVAWGMIRSRRGECVRLPHDKGGIG